MPSADVPPLAFIRYDMSEAGSAAALFVGSRKLCGIYVLEFENGQRYVGQTRNIVARYAAHRRHHGDVVAFSFAACPEKELDRFEKQEIRRQEEVHSLRNIALTGWPRGDGTVGVSLEEGRSVLLPWDRDRRGRVGEESIATHPGRFFELARRDDYDDLSRAVALYIGETIADPFGTEKALWTVSALPSTKQTKTRRRLLTLSCGVLETVFAQTEGPADALTIVANVDAPTFDELVGELGQRLPVVFENGYDAAYRSAEVAAYEFDSWGAFEEALNFEPFVEAAYKLNTTMMRRGGSPLRRHHNSFFANDLLRRAATRTS